MRLPLIINETGNVFMFETREQAEGYLEAVDVEDNRYIGYDSEGRLLCLKVRHAPRPVGFRNRLRQALHGGALSRVEIELAEAEPRYAAELHQLLKQILARRDVPEDWLARASLSELVEAARPRLTIKW